MPDREEEGTRLRRRLSQEAIALAMQSQWEEAVYVNQSIIESLPTDADAYNRLGRAFMELGEFARAREAYSRALEILPGNVIARKNLGRLSVLSEDHAEVREDRRKITPGIFVAEMGRTGVVALDYSVPQEILARMVAGDQVYLKVNGQRLIVENDRGEYLGEVGARYAPRLIKLMEGGNEYMAAIVGIAEGKMKVIIREKFQHPSQLGRVSFPVEATADFRTHVKDTLLRYGTDEEAEDLQLEEEVELLPEGFSILNGSGHIEDAMIGDELTEEE